MVKLVKVDGSVLAEARTAFVIAPTSPAHDHQYVLSAATTGPDLDPSPLATIRKGFDAFLAKSRQTVGQKSDKKSPPTTNEKDEMFREFLPWPQNPLEVGVNVRLTSGCGVGEVIDTLTVKNSEIIVTRRKQTAFVPQAKPARPACRNLRIPRSRQPELRTCTKGR